jgi:putative AdoMet-dependent methyltransferase
MSTHDFTELFDQWAPVYDQTVYDQDGEYNEVFEKYDRILGEVVKRIPAEARDVLEIGVGTGNLSRKLLEAGFRLIGVEPSAEMRRQVKAKGLNIDLRDGHFLQLPLDQGEQVDAIVSTYAFHHLTLSEKREALLGMRNILRPNGVIVFADTCYESEEAKAKIIARVRDQGKQNLLRDLETEFYELHDDLRQAFQQAGFSVSFSPMNRFVWLMTARLGS